MVLPVLIVVGVIGLLRWIKDQDLSFAETVEKAQHDLGNDARLVGISAQQNLATYQTVAPDGQGVVVTRYVLTCKRRGNNTVSHCEQGSSQRREHPARGGLGRAPFTVGALSGGLVKKLYREAGIDERQARVIFDGRRWQVYSFADPIHPRLRASFDGTPIP